MSTVTIVLLVILVILIAALIGLYFFGKKAQKKQEEQQAQIEATKQTVSMLVIDKKRMPLKESGLPQMVIEQTPKLMRRSKLPIVKAKIGPSKRSLYCRRKRNPRFPSDTGSQKERFLCKIQERQNCQINAVRHIN